MRHSRQYVESRLTPCCLGNVGCRGTSRPRSPLCDKADSSQQPHQPVLSARPRRPPFGPPSSLRRRGPNIPSTTQTRRRPAGSTNEARTFRQEESGLRQMPARAWPLQRVDRPVAIAASTPDHRQGRRTRPSTDYSRRRQATPGGRGAPCAGVAEQRVGTKPRGTPRIGCQRLHRRLPQPECPTPASPRRRTSQSRRLQVRGKPDCSAR